MFLVAVPSAQALKYFDSSFPSASGPGCNLSTGCAGAAATGGLFGGPRDIAVNQPSTPAQPQDGWIYVVDQANNRIQAFNANKVFQFAIGRDVIKSSPTGGSVDLGNVFEKCTIAQDCQAGATGSLGGEFNVVQGIDIDQATGNFYVRERNSNARVQQFGPDGTFIRAFGLDVVQPGGTGEVINISSERQTVALSAGFGFGTVTGGTFTLTFSGQTTAAVPYNASAAAVDAALEALPNVGAGNVAVTGAAGGTWTVDFTGALAGTNVAQLTGSGAGLTETSGLGATVDVATTVAGGPLPGFETCTVAAQCKAGTTGNQTGQFGSATTANSTGIAVTPSGAPNAGAVFVVDPGNRRVQRFTVPASPTGSVVANAPIGSSAQFLSSNQPLHVAIDGNGVVYASDGSGNAGHVNRYDTVTSSFKDRLTGGPSALLRLGSVKSMEVDPSTGNLFIGRDPSVGIMEFDLGDNPAQVNESHLVGISGTGLNIGSPQDATAAMTGIAFDGASGEMFVSTLGAGAAGTGTGHRILVLDDDGIEPPPTVVLLPAEDVGCTSVTLRADINPNGPTGFPTAYRFEVSKTGLPNDWTAVGSGDALVGATGDSGVFESVEQPVTGLEANTPLYRFRVRTIRSPGQPAVISAPQLFATAPCPPTVETIASQQVSDSSAQLVGRLNPSGLTTSYWFEWGDTDYGNTIPIPAATATGSTERLVAETVPGLAADTTYHFRLCAQNSLAPTPVCGADKAFATRQPASSGAARAYEMVSSPDKVLRRGGVHGPQDFDAATFSDALPSVDGESVLWSIFAGVADPDAGAGFSPDRAPEVRRRSADGWYGESALNVPMAPGVSAPNTYPYSVSADLNTQWWGTIPTVFPTGEGTAVRVMGDTGGPLNAGWYPFNETDGYVNGARVSDDGSRLLAYGNVSSSDQGFRSLVPLDDDVAPSGLTPPQTAGEALFLAGPPTWKAADLVNECTGTWTDERQTIAVDATGGSFTLTFQGQTTAAIAFDASAMNVQAALVALPNVALNDVVVTGDSGGSWTVTFSGAAYAGTDLAPMTASSAGLTGGAATATVATVDNGDPGTATRVVQRHHNGTDASTADDFTATRPCGVGSPTDVRGASVVDGSTASHRLGSSSASVLSEDGRRVFFSTPSINVADPDGSGTSQTACTTATGSATTCPAQLFVRHFDDAGNPVVRWVSRAVDELFDAPQDIGLVGGGVGFEGASRDGSVVYFRTNAPLTVDDPNGGPLAGRPVVDGVASKSSWDLYRYELGGGDPAPPGEDPASRLTRISGGPDGTADPNTNCAQIASSGADTGNCSGSSGSNIPNGEGGVVRFMSDDGERVYFVTVARIPGASNARPAGGATDPTADGAQVNATSRNLYLYDAQKSGAAAYEFVSQISFSTASGNLDSCLSGGTSPGPLHGVNFTLSVAPMLLRGGSNCVRGTSSGDAIVFESTARLTGDDTDDAADVYLYDAVSDELTRLSAPSPDASAYVCQTTNVAPTPLMYCNADIGMYNVPFGNLSSGDGLGSEGMRGWNVSEDDVGRLKAVYFESRLSLAEGAAVNDRMKVYEWRRNGGRMSLISPADSSESAFYTGNSQDGDDVFFWTEQRLSGWEIDGADGDIYNATARPDPVPEPGPAPQVCAVLAGGCQGGDVDQVSVPAETSRGGGGNASTGERATLTVAGVGAKARRAAVRTGVLAVRVRSDRAGRVSVSARARIARRDRTIAKGARTLAGPGVVTVRLRLNAQARSALRAGRRLAVSLRAQQPGARPRSTSVLLRRPQR